MASLAALLMVAAPLVPQGPDLPAIVYRQVAGHDLVFDLWHGAGPGPHPVVLWVHGGAWVGGVRTLDRSFITGILGAGISVASLDYRLASEGSLFGPDLVVFPAQLEDVQACLRFMRIQAPALNLDPSRMGTFGHSAGGHLAALAGARGRADDPLGDSRLRCVVASAAPVDFFSHDEDAQASGCTSWLAFDPPSSPASLLVGFAGPGEGIGVLRDLPGHPAHSLVLEANPALDLAPGLPDLLILQGAQDCHVSPHQAERLRDAWVAAGARVDFVPHVQGHTIPDPQLLRAWEFLVACLGPAGAAPLHTERFTVVQEEVLDEGRWPPDQDNETPAQATTLWGACNLTTTVGAPEHSISLMPGGVLSHDGNALVFHAGAQSAGSRVQTILPAALDLGAGGVLSLVLSRCNSSGVLFPLLRTAGAWWRGEAVQLPPVPSRDETVILPLPLAELTFLRIDPSEAATADLDEQDDGGETGPLVVLGAGQPDWRRVEGFGFELGGGHDLSPGSWLAVDDVSLGAQTLGRPLCHVPVALPSARLTLTGSPVAAEDRLIVLAEGLPAHQLGYLIASPTGHGGVPVPGAATSLCLGPPLLRVLATLDAADAAGHFRHELTLGGAPFGPDPGLQTGVTFCFQLWHRLPPGGPAGSAFSDAIEVTFQ